MLYALAVLEEAKKAASKPSAGRVDRILKLLSNGFVLLLAGSVISSLLIPTFQRRMEERKTRIETRQECFAQFLLYANSRWQEYYLLVPLVAKGEISSADYQKALEDLTAIKVRRYDAYAKLQALALAFRRRPQEPNQVIEGALHDYAVRVNDISRDIDAWLRNAYCFSYDCKSVPGAAVDPEFEPYAGFDRLKKEVVTLTERDTSVAGLIASYIDREEGR